MKLTIEENIGKVINPSRREFHRKRHDFDAAKKAAAYYSQTNNSNMIIVSAAGLQKRYYLF